MTKEAQGSPKTINPKIQEFLDKVSDLAELYQLDLVPTLIVKERINKVPKKGKTNGRR
jgi:hypothetical protein